MLELRVRQSRTTIGVASGPDEISVEAEALRYAMQNRSEASVTIERKHRTASSVYWKRHMLIEQWPLPGGDDA